MACKISLTKKLNGCRRENVVSVTPSTKDIEHQLANQLSFIPWLKQLKNIIDGQHDFPESMTLN